jgi:hypothetical protein
LAGKAEHLDPDAELGELADRHPPIPPRYEILEHRAIRQDAPEEIVGVFSQRPPVGSRGQPTDTVHARSVSRVALTVFSTPDHP